MGLKTVIQHAIENSSDGNENLFWSGAIVMCRRCIEEEEMWPRFEGDDPNEWALSDTGIIELYRQGFDETIDMNYFTLTEEQLEEWFVFDYHPKYRSRGNCINRLDNSCMGFEPLDKLGH